MSNKNNYGRQITSLSKYSVWVSANGKCVFCNIHLLSWTFDNKSKKNKVLGEIAHIISANNDRIRPNFIKSQVINDRFKQEMDENKNEFNFDVQENNDEKQRYSSKLLSHHKNLILLCPDCHYSFDLAIENERLSDDLNDIITQFKTNDFIDEKYKKLFLYLDKYNLLDQSLKLNIPLINFDEQNKEEMLNFIIDFCNESKNELLLNIQYQEIKEEDFNDFVRLYNKFNNKELKNKNKESFQEALSFFLKKYTVGFRILTELKKIDIFFKEKDKYGVLNNASKNKDFLLKNKISSFKSYKNISFIENSSFPNKNLYKNRPDYKIIKKILLKYLEKNISSENSWNVQNFYSISIAYFSRWGTGKTSMIKTLANDLNEFYNYVEINLWNISNLVNISQNKDDPFVRNIVKEAITQIINNEDYVKKYLDSKKQFISQNENYLNFKNEVLDSILGITNKDKTESVNIFQERSKFIDQFICHLQEVINVFYRTTNRPTIFVFDDIDRINDEEKIVKILDSIVSFLNLKNCIYILPLDESKILKSIKKHKNNCEPTEYVNKYFNYCIRSSFIPKINAIEMFEELIKDIDFLTNTSVEIKRNIFDKTSNFIEPSYRSFKDYINKFIFNKFMFDSLDIDVNRLMKRLFNSKKIVFKNNEYNDEEIVSYFISVSTILHNKFPMMIDYISKDINNIRLLIDIIRKKSKELEQESFFNFDSNISEILSFLLNDEIKLKSSNISNIFVLDSNDEENIKIKIKEKVHFIKNIFDAYNIFEIEKNQKLVILFWITLTLAEIKNEKFIEYLEFSRTELLLDGYKESFDMNKEDDLEVIDNYFKSFLEFKSIKVFDDERFYELIQKILLLEELELLQETKKINNLFKSQQIINEFLKYFSKVIDEMKNIDTKSSSNEENDFLRKFVNLFNYFTFAKNIKTKFSFSIDDFEKFLNKLNKKGSLNVEIVFDSFNLRAENTFKISNESISTNIIKKIINSKMNIKISVFPYDFKEKYNEINIKDWFKIIEININLISSFFMKVKSNEKMKILNDMLNSSIIKPEINIVGNKSILNEIERIKYNDFIQDNIIEVIINENYDKYKKFVNQILEIFWKKIMLFGNNKTMNNFFEYLFNPKFLLENKKLYSELIFTKIVEKFTLNNFIDEVNKKINDINEKTEIIEYIYDFMKYKISGINDINLIKMCEIEKKVFDNKYFSFREKLFFTKKTFNRDFAYQKMKFQIGANIDDIKNYQMIYNESISHKEYVEIFKNYLNVADDNFDLLQKEEFNDKVLSELINNIFKKTPNDFRFVKIDYLTKKIKELKIHDFEYENFIINKNNKVFQTKILKISKEKNKLEEKIKSCNLKINKTLETTISSYFSDIKNAINSFELEFNKYWNLLCLNGDKEYIAKKLDKMKQKYSEVIEQKSFVLSIDKSELYGKNFQEIDKMIEKSLLNIYKQLNNQLNKILGNSKNKFIENNPEMSDFNSFYEKNKNSNINNIKEMYIKKIEDI
ncbi:hypothetical protein ACJA28_02450 [Mesomycoplasma moatsii]|uniref:hypothetical protein n=1 Tax=Mesomycoplasma moatsii TaxID=171287 RepID=UPI0003B43C95